MKECGSCRKALPLTFYHKNRSQKDGYAHWCKTCVKSWRRPADHNLQQQLRRYGLTLGQYKQMVEERNNLCDICGEPEEHSTKKNLSVDHNATTGEIRGLLCHSCNVMLGLAAHSTILLSQAIRYLQKNGIRTPQQGRRD